MSDSDKERKIPLLLIAAGVVLYALAAMIHAGTGGVVPTLIAASIGAVVATILLIGAAFIVASLMKVSFGDGGAAVTKFAAATLFSGGVGALLPFGNFVALFVFLSLVMWLFDLELTYAIVLTVVYFLVSFLVALFVVAALR